MKKILVYILIGILSVLLIMKLTNNTSPIIEDTEHNKIVKKLKSPNGNRVAVGFIRDFGATTDFSPQVSLLDKNDNFDDEIGNVFIGSGSKFIDMKWSDDTTITIFYKCSDDKITLKKDYFKGISILYRKL